MNLWTALCEAGTVRSGWRGDIRWRVDRGAARDHRLQETAVFWSGVMLVRTGLCALLGVDVP